MYVRRTFEYCSRGMGDGSANKGRGLPQSRLTLEW